AVGELQPEGHRQLLHPVAARVANLVPADLHHERLRLGSTGREDVDVDRGAPADGGQEQLDRREGLAVPGAEIERAAPTVDRGIAASRRAGDGDRSMRVSSHGLTLPE